MITAEQKPIDEIRGMMAPYRRVLVLGPGCKKCESLFDRAREVLEQMGQADVELEHVKDLDEITAYGPVVTPALVIYDQLVSSGRVPSHRSPRDILSRHLT